MVQQRIIKFQGDLLVAKSTRTTQILLPKAPQNRHCILPPVLLCCWSYQKEAIGLLGKDKHIEVVNRTGLNGEKGRGPL